ncbi:MAG: helix-turn-helix domain-containing protein [Acidimicrobiia bacterium]
MLSFDELPEVLTVEEAAEVLRIGRTLAYELARRFELSAGAAGLPVLRIGRVLRVPKSALARILAGELQLEPAASSTPASATSASAARAPRRASKRRRSAQLSLLEQPEA